VIIVIYRLFFWSFLVLAIFVLTTPIMYLSYEGFFGRYSDPYRSFSLEILSSIALTVVASTIATAIALAIGAPVAYYLARYRFRGQGLVEALIDLPTSVPHPLVGIAILLLLGPVGPLSPILKILGIGNISYTLIAMILALLIVSTPVMIKSLANSFKSMDPQPEIAALTLGISRIRVFLLIALPMSMRSIVNSFAITLARSISEFGSIAVVAYYILTPPFQGVKPASVLAWDLFESGGLGAALPASASIFLLSLAVLFLVRISERISR
jgi:molybdate/tungstate transport system permease protein